MKRLIPIAKGSLWAAVVIVAVVSLWLKDFESTSWQAGIPIQRQRMARDLVDHVLYHGMPEEEVCLLLGPDTHGRCADDPHAPKNSHWKLGHVRSVIMPLIGDELELTIIYDRDRRVSQWMLLHPRPSLWSPSSWVLPF